MKLRPAAIALVLSCPACLPLLGADAPAAAPKAPAPPATRPSLTDADKQAGWRLLFDGATAAGWRGLGRDEFPKERWVVTDGCLRCLGNAGSKAKSDDLVTVDEFENFELEFEWMIPKPGGNAGVKYRVQEKKGETFAFGPEYQLMADGDAADKHATGSLYDVLPPAGKKLRPDGEFNHSRIVVRGDHGEHWLNGVKVVDFDFGSEAVKAAQAQSKFKNRPDWARPARGHIALQDHGDEVWFRNVKVREVKGEGKQ